MLLERVRLTTPTSPQRRHAGGHRLVTRPLAVTSAVLTGLMGGGMVVIQVVLLPFWRGAAPAEFRGWFTAHVGRIRGLMVPLGAGTGLVCAASAVAQRVGGGRSTPASVGAAAATAGVIAITVTVNEPMNHRFAGETLTDTETTELLRRWARWHHVRVVLGVTATVAAAAALTRQDA
jgi:uncharacterized membrane protein